MYDLDSDNGAFTEYFSECCTELSVLHISLHLATILFLVVCILHEVRQLMFLTSLFPVLQLSLVVWRGVCMIAEVVTEAMD